MLRKRLKAANDLKSYVEGRLIHGLIVDIHIKIIVHFNIASRLGIYL